MERQPMTTKLNLHLPSASAEKHFCEPMTGTRHTFKCHLSLVVWEELRHLRAPLDLRSQPEIRCLVHIPST
jgi:hypothetical protein